MASGTKSLWRNRDYLLLWSGQIISLTGTGITQLAFPLLVLAIATTVNPHVRHARRQIDVVA